MHKYKIDVFYGKDDLREIVTKILIREIETDYKFQDVELGVHRANSSSKRGGPSWITSNEWMVIIALEST